MYVNKEKEKDIVEPKKTIRECISVKNAQLSIVLRYKIEKNRKMIDNLLNVPIFIMKNIYFYLIINIKIKLY